MTPADAVSTWTIKCKWVWNGAVVSRKPSRWWHDVCEWDEQISVVLTNAHRMWSIKITFGLSSVKSFQISSFTLLQRIVWNGNSSNDYRETLLCRKCFQTFRQKGCCEWVYPIYWWHLLSILVHSIGAYGGAEGAGVCGLLWGSTLQTIHYGLRKHIKLNCRNNASSLKVFYSTI